MANLSFIPHSPLPTPHSGRSIWIVKFWLNNKSYRPNASPLQQIVPTPHSPLPTPQLIQVLLEQHIAEISLNPPES